jgi:hypothetical protein
MTLSPKVKAQLLDSIAQGIAQIVYEERRQVDEELRLLRDEIAVLRARLDAGVVDSAAFAERLRAELATAKSQQEQPQRH